MKTRLACRVARALCALRETSSSAHVAGCADCQSYFRTATTLESALRREAPATRAAVPANFERDLLRAVREAAAEENLITSPRPRASLPALPWRSLATFGAVAAALVLGAFLFQRRAEPLAPTRAEALAFLDTVGTATERLTEEVIPTAGTLIADNPLQTEFTALESDARAAVDFLALNFLPRSAIVASNSRSL